MGSTGSALLATAHASGTALQAAAALAVRVRHTPAHPGRAASQPCLLKASVGPERSRPGDRPAIRWRGCILQSPSSRVPPLHILPSAERALGGRACLVSGRFVWFTFVVSASLLSRGKHSTCPPGGPVNNASAAGAGGRPGPGNRGFLPGCAPDQLCDPGQVSEPLWASSPCIQIGAGTLPNPEL